MRYFYVAMAETRKDMIQAAVDTIAEWDEKTRRHDIRIGILIRYTKWRLQKCTPCLLARERGLPVFVDNGAFSYLTASDLESTLDIWTLARWRYDYASWLRLRLEEYDHAAMPDIPVHGRRFLSEGERKERIKLSAGNQSLFLNLVPNVVREKLVPVLQGYTIKEYEESYRLLERYDILENTAYGSWFSQYSERLAVGSICVRKWSSNGKTSVLAEGKAAGTLKDWLSRFLAECCKGARGFHFFGLHREAVIRFGLHDRFYSADSGAHGLNFRLKWKTFLGCREPNAECYAKAVEHQLGRMLQPLLQKPVEAFF